MDVGDVLIKYRDFHGLTFKIVHTCVTNYTEVYVHERRRFRRENETCGAQNKYYFNMLGASHDIIILRSLYWTKKKKLEKKKSIHALRPISMETGVNTRD